MILATILLCVQSQASESVLHLSYTRPRIDPVDGKKWIVTGHGSGTVIDLSEFGFTEKNLVLTARHVVEDSDDNFTKDNGEKIKIKVIYKDKFFDLAVVQLLTDKEFKTVKLSTSNSIVVGQLYNYEGFPKGEHDVSSGTVKYLHPNGYEYVANCEGFFHGWSGGAVFDDNGLVGICTGMEHANEHPKGVPNRCVFLPIDRIKQILLFYKFTLNSSVTKL